MKIMSEQEVNIALENERLKLTKEFERIQQIADYNERLANIIRRDIIDNILTLRCPKCKYAFVDFDGCFALTCANRQCQIGFCAWCLEDCGGDAHQHVANCKQNKNNGSVHGRLDQFQTHHQERKGRAIDQKLNSCDEYVASLVYSIIQDDLKGTGVQIKHRGNVQSSRIHSTSIDTNLWSIEPSIRHSTYSIYSILHSNVSNTVSKENYEYNQAAAHFTRLLQMGYSKIRRVEIVEYKENSDVKRRYFDTKAEYLRSGHGDEIWVFHGTSKQGIDGIVEHGFKVGGVDEGIPVANGAAYGNGVYTAISPNTPIGYAQDSKCVVLARGLKGQISNHKVVNDYAVIFNSGSQLLPCYLVHFA
jgi:hypothetical protein